MIYVILNAALAAYLVWTSMNVNTKNQGAESSMINTLLLDASAAVVMFLSVLSVYHGPEKISILLDHLVLFLVAAIYTEISMMLVSVSKRRKSVSATVLKVIFLILAAYVAFFKIHISDASVFEMKSDLILSGAAASAFPITWLQIFIVCYVFVLPIFGFLILILTGENFNSRLLVQRALMCIGAVAFGWAGLALVYYIAEMLPMMRSLFMYIIAVMSIMIMNTVTQDKIYDGGMLVSAVLSMLIKYIAPAAIGAALYVGLRPMYTENYWLYLFIIFMGTFVLMLAGRFLSSSFSKLIKYRSSQYEEEFERELASIDYENELSDISKEFFRPFQTNMQTSSMTVLVDSGSGEYSTVYNSDGKTYTLAKIAKAREVLVNNEIFIVFREDIENSYVLQPVKEEIYKIFDETDAEVLILLHEGHHILGLLLLGEKRTGGMYDEYDKQVLDKFYSYFFVFGYYMKNIANASVVGTVNREIRMSSQIITSIQENMDYIRNPKIDVGYLMVPAHNIGGEFVDLIRLTDTSHIMVIGSLSGKGISASMSMVILKSIIRTFLADTHDFKKLIQKVNAFIRFNLPKGTFFAGLFCLMDFATDTLYYVNCGIPTMLEYSKTYNNVIEIQGKGYVLGFVKDVSPLVKVKQVKLISGDMLAITTSGVINSHSLRGEQFGKERIKQALMDNYTYPASRIARFTYDNLQRFMSKELEDDVTMLVVKYHGKDAVAVSEDDDVSAQEHIADHADSFDADALLDGVIEDTSDS
uniref:PP2C family protein-serine/threonine phosphatase n=1 Tax=Treponema sp. TaxID=166 RepID=UPI00298E4811